MPLSNDLISQFVKATKVETPKKTESTVYAEIISCEPDGTIYARFDGSEEITPVATTTDVSPGERVIITVKNHSATITGNLSSPSAKTATVQGLDSKLDNKLDSDEFVLVTASLVSTEQLETEQGRITYLESLNATINNALNANTAAINKLTAKDAEITGKVTANEAAIGKLSAGYGEIKTLIFGSATGDTIHSSFANSVVAQIGDAQIKSAMIDSIAASKITAGDIITNNVRVKSQNGSLLIAGETIQISDSSRVRVQIGKDASNDYSINIWDAAGKLMFSEGGITDSAIKDAIIRNDMVSDTANIAAHKLDIDSLFDEINGSTKTIKSTKVYLDEKKQTLDVAFKTLTTDVSALGETVSSQGTTISAIQGQITSKIWQQDINTATNAMNTKYTSLEQSLSKFETTVSGTYATKTDLDGLEIGGRNLFKNTKNPSDASHWTRGNITLDADLNENVFYMKNASGTETTSGTHRVRVEPGQTYTISAYVKPTKNVRSVDFFFLSREKDATSDFTINQHKSNMTPEADVWTKLCWTFVVNENAYEGYLRIDHNGSTDGADAFLYYTMIKMESGDKATDWSPAPEDLATNKSVTSLSTRVTQTESGISAQASQISSLGGRVNTVELAADGLTMQLNNMQVGGRNLISGTSKNETVLGTFPASGHSEGASFRTIAIPTKNEYILSFDAKSTVAGDVIRCFFYSPNTTTEAKSSEGNTSTGVDGAMAITLTTSWKRYWVKYTQDGSATNAAKALLVGRRMAGTGTGSVSIRAVKLEEGHIPTDWTPAPEDVSNDILAAGKTATNYLNFSSSGLVVGDHTASSLGNNVLIDSSAVKVRTGTTVNSVFGADLIELAKNNSSATISMLNGAFKIYYDADNSDGGFGIYGKTSTGEERLAFQAVNENDNLTLGWGGYAAKANSTNIYGHKIYLTTNDDIILNPGSGNIQMDGNLVLTNGKNLFGKNTSGAMRSMAILNASNQMVFGYGSYENSEGNTFYEGNIVSIISRSDVSITPGSGNVKIDGNVALTNGKNLFGTNTSGTMRSMAVLNASNQMLFGYGSYSNSEGSVYYDGNNVTMRSKNDITFQTPNEKVALEDNSGGATYSAFFRPESNGKCTLGLAAKRWYAVYATNSTVQTSDAREKENISSLGDIHSELFDRLNPVQYNFINGNGKICYGLLSQEVIESMEELGIGEHDLDLVHHDFFTDDNGEEQDTFGITYTNLIAMLIHEVQKLKTEIKHLKIT